MSNQMRIERKTLKEEILREIRDDREKHEEIRRYEMTAKNMRKSERS